VAKAKQIGKSCRQNNEMAQMAKREMAWHGCNQQAAWRALVSCRNIGVVAASREIRLENGASMAAQSSLQAATMKSIEEMAASKQKWRRPSNAEK